MLNDFLLQKLLYLLPTGGLAQLARALAWHARGRRFDPDTLHSFKSRLRVAFYFLQNKKAIQIESPFLFITSFINSHQTS